MTWTVDHTAVEAKKVLAHTPSQQFMNIRSMAMKQMGRPVERQPAGVAGNKQSSRRVTMGPLPSGPEEDSKRNGASHFCGVLCSTLSTLPKFYCLEWFGSLVLHVI